jgi:PBSX family phage terminase large subunit
LDVKLDELISPNFYSLHQDIKKNLYDEIWLKGGRGSTKSSFISIELILMLLKDIDFNAIVMRRYSNELRDTVYGQLEWAILKMELGDLFKFQYAPMQIVYIPTGQKILFKGADNPSKLKSINIGKGHIMAVWMEEVAHFSGMDSIRNIIQSLFRGEEKKRVSFYSYNPPKSGRSWVNQEVKIPKSGRCVHHSDYRDVPPGWLGERFLTDADHLRTVNDNAYRHEYLGEEVGTGLEVFLNVSLQVIPDHEVYSFDQIRQGLDWGYAADPLCFERMNYNRKKRTLHIFHEISGLNLFNRVFYERAKRYSNIQTTADSAEPKSIDEVKSYGMKIIGAKKGPGSVESGVKFLQDMEHIIIDPVRCPLAAREFINYALETDRNGEIKNKFPDKDNHSLDSVRYALEDDMPKPDKTPHAPQVGFSFGVGGGLRI